MQVLLIIYSSDSACKTRHEYRSWILRSDSFRQVFYILDEEFKDWNTSYNTTIQNNFQAQVSINNDLQVY